MIELGLLKDVKEAFKLVLADECLTTNCSKSLLEKRSLETEGTNYPRALDA